MKLERYYAHANEQQREFEALRNRLVQGSYTYQMFARLDQIEHMLRHMNKKHDDMAEAWAQCPAHIREQVRACELGEYLDRLGPASQQKQLPDVADVRAVTVPASTE